MIGFAADDLVDLRRWAICGAIVVLTHGGIAAAVVNWRDSDEAAEPAAAIVIEFAPVPVAPAMPQMEIPPGPEQVMSDASPNKPTESLEEKIEEKIEQKVEAKLEQKVEEKVDTKPVEEPPPEVAPAPDPEVAVQPPPPQEVKQETPKRQEPRPPAPTTSAPQAIPEQMAAIPAAPTQGQIIPTNSNVVPTWKTQIVALLERNKRYPETAQSRREQGVAQVFFSLDRQGRVLESRVVRSSGANALDAEALALLRRAQPFPPPPRELAGDHIDLTVPIRFNLK
jgi:periplasmic protein TonB